MSLRTTYKYIVRDYPHPKYPRGTIVFAVGMYELPDGSRYNVADDVYLATVNPPTDRNKLAGVKSYGPGM